MLITRLVSALRRREGHTTAAARSGATVLCMNKTEADRVRREHGCDTASIQYPEKLRCRFGPKVVDVSTLYELERDASKWLSNMRAGRNRWRRNYIRVQAEVERLAGEVNRLTHLADSRGLNLLIVMAERDEALQMIEDIRRQAREVLESIAGEE